MVITNLKIFNETCKTLEKISKPIKQEQIYSNVFFMTEHNRMIVTNGEVMVMREMYDCTINNERFCFPCNVKPMRIAVGSADRFIIKNVKDKFFDNSKKFVIDFNVENLNEFIVPSGKADVISEYNFNQYPMCKIHIDKKNYYSATVMFASDGSVEFDYHDDFETKANYYDVHVGKDDFFESDVVSSPLPKNILIPMYVMYIILKTNTRFILNYYVEKQILTIVCNKYTFIIKEKTS